MKRNAENKPPADADARNSAKPMICYPTDTLFMQLYELNKNGKFVQMV